MLILTQIEVFIFFMAIMVIINCFLHIIAVFYLKTGKLVTSNLNLFLFGASLAYILTIIKCGFIN